MNKKVNTILLNFLRGFAPTVFNFVITILGFYYCGSANWGEISGLILLIFFFNFVGNWGNKEFLIRAFSENPAQIKSLFLNNVIARLILLVLPISLFFYYSFEIGLTCFALVLVRFVYNSFESLIVYHQKFKIHLIAETLGFLVLLFGILWKDEFDLSFFLWIYFYSSLIKAIVLFWIFKPLSAPFSLKFDWTILKVTAPFFLISLAGWLHSKIDLYIVDFHLSSAKFAEYQILIGAFLLLDTLPALLVQPFTKHIYRTDPKTIANLRKLLKIIGIPVVLIGSFGIYLLIDNFTTIEFSKTTYLIMGIGAIPPYLYMIDIFILYRQKKEKLIMRLGFIGAAINLTVGLVFVPIYGILGAAIAVAASKLIMLTVPFFATKSTSVMQRMDR